MKYRKFGKLDWNVSSLGFGCMRLPTTDKRPMSGNIIEDESIRMIRYAIDQGVNYIDTAYPYHSGRSEIVVGNALGDGYRQKVKLATKSPVWNIKCADDFDKYLNEQLSKLKTDHIDFYLLHALDKKRWENIILKYDIFKKAEDAIRDGKIINLGFSYHDVPSTFKVIVDRYDGWKFCQIQYNYLDIENQAGTAGLRYAASKGLAIVIMEPLLGGKLANIPDSVKIIFDEFEKKRTPIDWALHWVWDHPEVSVVLSGMSSMEQVKSNISAAEISKSNTFTPEEKTIIDRIREIYKEKMPIPCTKCGYCLPCPNDVNIPRVFELYNDAFIHNDLGTSKGSYNYWLPENERASSCLECGTCEEDCPQRIPISSWMSKVHEMLVVK